MPKTVEPAARCCELAEAVWRVMQRDGIEGASVRARSPAKPACRRLAAALLHQQEEFLAFAIQMVIEREELK